MPGILGLVGKSRKTVANEDLYRELQVSPDAEPEVIEAAYRKLAQK